LAEKEATEIMQDYADHSRKAVIKFYKDTIQFWNPGDVFGNYGDLLEPGEKEVRNPRIVSAFRRLALCEQAGTGMRMMRNQWRALEHPDLESVRRRLVRASLFPK
jgi:ATP-dependent DNA helicase RecG